MKYISERITNIGDLEQIIEKCSTISKILETELPNNKKIKTKAEWWTYRKCPPLFLLWCRGKCMHLCDAFDDR